jgi:hypothetical protein
MAHELLAYRISHSFPRPNEENMWRMNQKWFDVFKGLGAAAKPE